MLCRARAGERASTARTSNSAASRAGTTLVGRSQTPRVVSPAGVSCAPVECEEGFGSCCSVVSIYRWARKNKEIYNKKNNWCVYNVASSLREFWIGEKLSVCVLEKPCVTSTRR